MESKVGSFLASAEADARQSLETGIAILEETGVRDGEGDALSHLGWALKRLDLIDKARTTLVQSVKLAQAAGDLAAEALSRFRIATIDRDSDHRDEALNEIRRTLYIVEDLRRQGYDPDLRAAFLANIRMYYEFAIDLLEDMHAQQRNTT